MRKAGVKRFISFAVHASGIVLLSLSIAHPISAAAQDSSGDRRIIERVEPAYPALAQRNGLSGTVKLRVLIGADGRAKKVEVLGGNPVFVDNASESVKKWKWVAADHESTETVQLNFSPRN